MNKFAGLLGVLAIVALAPAARANLVLTVNGSTCAALAFGTPPGPPGISITCPTLTGPTDGLPVGVSVNGYDTTGTQAANGSEQLSSTVAVENTTGSAVTIDFGAAISNFSFPLAPPNISDASSITLNQTLPTPAGSTSTGLLTSCVDQNNGLVVLGCAGAPGQAGPNPLVSVTGAQTNGDTTFGTITSLVAPFSLEQSLVLTIGPNASLNFTLTQGLTPVPEPGGIVLLGTAILGLTTLFRKKLMRG